MRAAFHLQGVQVKCQPWTLSKSLLRRIEGPSCLRDLLFTLERAHTRTERHLVFNVCQGGASPMCRGWGAVCRAAEGHDASPTCRGAHAHTTSPGGMRTGSRAVRLPREAHRHSASKGQRGVCVVLLLLFFPQRCFCSYNKKGAKSYSVFLRCASHGVRNVRVRGVLIESGGFPFLFFSQKWLINSKWILFFRGKRYV